MAGKRRMHAIPGQRHGVQVRQHLIEGNHIHHLSWSGPRQAADGYGVNAMGNDDTSVRNRLEVARKCGLEATSNPMEESLKGAVERAFGGAGFDVRAVVTCRQSCLDGRLRGIPVRELRRSSTGLGYFCSTEVRL